MDARMGLSAFVEGFRRGWSIYRHEEAKRRAAKRQQQAARLELLGGVVGIMVWLTVVGGVLLGALYLLVRFIKWAWAG